VDVDELQRALGGIVLEAAYLERVLRTAFSALVGSKYAAVIDGRLTTATLIEDCDTWATRPGSVMITLHGGRKSHEVTVTAQTLGEVRHLAEQVAGAAHDLRAAMATALGSGWGLVENELQQELGYDITTGSGR
jgi:hypothetical protein